MLEAIYSLPYLVLEVPTLKIKTPSWFHQPSAMTVFSFVLLSYFLVTGGNIHTIFFLGGSISYHKSFLGNIQFSWHLWRKMALLFSFPLQNLGILGRILGGICMKLAYFVLLDIVHQLFCTFYTNLNVFVWMYFNNFLYSSGIIYDVIVEPPSVGSTTDEHGHSRPVSGHFIIKLKFIPLNTHTHTN